MNRVRALICDRKLEAIGLDGAGIGVAVLDTGAALHPDLCGRIRAFRDFVEGGREPYDDARHGTHVCGIICGSGEASGGKYRGVAPGCELIVGKILDKKGDGNIADLVNGINWVIENKHHYKIRILNISIGVTCLNDIDVERQAVEAVERAWRAGIFVVTSAGNMGPCGNTISTIGSSALVVTVGCHDGNYLKGKPVLCEHYSSRGPSKYAKIKPDIVAPGTNIVSCNAGFKMIGGLYKNLYEAKSGTSMSAPIVTGACALLSQKYPNHTNEMIKYLLIKHAVDLKEEHHKQGFGMLNITGAV